MKWAGNKRWIAGWIVKEMDNISTETGISWTVKGEETYIEPFCGTASMFLRLRSEGQISPNSKVILNDLNPVLINLYQCILEGKSKAISTKLNRLSKLYSIENSDGVIPKNLPKKERESRMYYKKRRRLNKLIKNFSRLSSNQRVELASLTVFLNKTCYNGLWRVNPRGDFNVPEGSYPKPSIPDDALFIEIEKLLEDVNISSTDWSESASLATDKSLVYFDPPYFPLDRNSNVFSDYEKGGFSDEDHSKLIEYCVELASIGVRVILSNHDSSELIERINALCEIKAVKSKEYRIPTRRKIGQKTSSRISVNELLIFLWS